MSQNPPDLDRLLERCRDRDECAWAELFSEFADQIARWLARLDYVLRERDIEDLRNEVFLKICRTLSTYRAEECPFRVWLYQQTHGIAIDNVRRRQAQKRIPPSEMVSLQSEPPANEPAMDPPDKGAMPDEIAAKNDSHRLLFKALDTLGSPDSRCRQLIECVIFGELTYQEAAQLLQMKEKTVSSALSRCLAELRQIYLKLFPGENLPPSAND